MGGSTFCRLCGSTGTCLCWDRVDNNSTSSSIQKSPGTSKEKSKVQEITKKCKNQDTATSAYIEEFADERNVVTKRTIFCKCSDTTRHKELLSFPKNLVLLVVYCESKYQIESRFLWKLYHFSFRKETPEIEDFFFGIDYLKCALSLIHETEAPPNELYISNRLNNTFLINPIKQSKWWAKMLVEIEDNDEKMLETYLGNGIFKWLSVNSPNGNVNFYQLYHVTSIFNNVCKEPKDPLYKKCFPLLTQILKNNKCSYRIGNLSTVRLVVE